MMDTPNFIDFFHLEAGRDRHGKIAACEGICWLLGRINPKKKLLIYFMLYLEFSIYMRKSRHFVSLLKIMSVRSMESNA
jgi:hypothetical protein